MAKTDLPECESVKQFLRGFHTEATRDTYSKKLSQFLRYIESTPDGFLAEAQKNPKSVQNEIIDYIEARRGEVSGSTIHQLVAALKHFFEMNDAEEEISWAKIAKIIPKQKKTGSDRAPTISEIRQMLKRADIRIRCIILVCASSGMRVGGFEGMTWGDITPAYTDGNKESPAAAKILVYRGSPEEYVAFASPECYEALCEYMDARRGAGEEITKSSPLIRDSWDSHMYRRYKSKDPATPKAISAKTISNTVGAFLKRMQIRAARGRHEFKQIHGFRKYFKTNAERAMKTIDVEKLMGHAENYYKPPESYLLEQYTKAVPHLTMSEMEGIKKDMKMRITVGDQKLGEIERENVELRDRLSKLEGSYGALKEILENTLLGKTKTDT